MNNKDLAIPVGNITLQGILHVPDKAKGLVIFSHGSGSSRLSPRNGYVARTLHMHGFATLLFDLLTEEEDRIYENRFDIDLLAERLFRVTSYSRRLPELAGLPVGYFGASTGSASAVKASVMKGNEIKVIVSRGGRPDLVNDEAHLVKAAVLLIVGGLDTGVIELNAQFFERLNCVKQFEIVPGATHLFEEEGKLEEVAELSAKWFGKHLRN